MSDQRKSITDALRDAVDKTFQSALGGSGVSGGSARDLVDEVVKRSEEGARSASEFGNRIRDSIKDLRLATGDDLKKIHGEIEEIRERLSCLEKDLALRDSQSRTEREPGQT